MSAVAVRVTSWSTSARRRSSTRPAPRSIGRSPTSSTTPASSTRPPVRSRSSSTVDRSRCSIAVRESRRVRRSWIFDRFHRADVGALDAGIRARIVDRPRRGRPGRRFGGTRGPATVAARRSGSRCRCLPAGPRPNAPEPPSGSTGDRRGLVDALARSDRLGGELVELGDVEAHDEVRPRSR